jgi:sodium-dependent phosphate transporter
MGPLLWSRPAPPDADTIGGDAAVPDYKIAIHDFNVHERAGVESTAAPISESDPADTEKGLHVSTASSSEQPQDPTPTAKDVDPHPIEGSWIMPKNLWIIFRYKIPQILTHGTTGT